MTYAFFVSEMWTHITDKNFRKIVKVRLGAPLVAPCELGVAPCEHSSPAPTHFYICICGFIRVSVCLVLHSGVPLQ